MESNGDKSGAIVAKIVLIIFLILFCKFDLLAQTEITPKEYSVYASVLKIIYKENRKTYSNKSHFVILKDTKADLEMDLTSFKKYKNLVKNFNQRNLTSAILKKNLPRGAYSETYYLVSQNEIDELFEKGQIEFNKRYEIEKSSKTILNSGGTTWTPFYEKYSEASGYYNLSRVGFNGVFAMVQIKKEDIHTGFSCTYILKKIKSKWKITVSECSEWVD